MSEIPTPSDSGSNGTQVAVGGGLIPAEKESPLKGLPIAQRVEGLAATHSRSMGGELAANLISGIYTQLSHDLQSSKQEIIDTRAQLSKAQSDLSDAKTRIAVLEERLRTDSRDRHLKNFCIFLGTTFIGLGIDLVKSDFNTLGTISAISGTVLLIFGWISSSKGSGE